MRCVTVTSSGLFDGIEVSEYEGKNYVGVGSFAGNFVRANFFSHNPPQIVSGKILNAFPFHIKKNDEVQMTVLAKPRKQSARIMVRIDTRKIGNTSCSGILDEDTEFIWQGHHTSGPSSADDGICVMKPGNFVRFNFQGENKDSYLNYYKDGRLLVESHPLEVEEDSAEDSE